MVNCEVCSGIIVIIPNKEQTDIQKELLLCENCNFLYDSIMETNSKKHKKVSIIKLIKRIKK